MRHLSLVNFEDVVEPAADFLKSWKRLYSLNSERVNEVWWSNSSLFPDYFYKSYQFHNIICVTAKREYKENFDLIIEGVDLNLPKESHCCDARPEGPRK